MPNSVGHCRIIAGVAAEATRALRHDALRLVETLEVALGGAQVRRHQSLMRLLLRLSRITYYYIVETQVRLGTGDQLRGMT